MPMRRVIGQSRGMPIWSPEVSSAVLTCTVACTRLAVGNRAGQGERKEKEPVKKSCFSTIISTCNFICNQRDDNFLLAPPYSNLRCLILACANTIFHL